LQALNLKKILQAQAKISNLDKGNQEKVNYRDPYNTIDPCVWNMEVVQCTPTGSIIGL
jgi:hypothetical protein